MGFRGYRWGSVMIELGLSWGLGVRVQGLGFRGYSEDLVMIELGLSWGSGCRVFPVPPGLEVVGVEIEHGPRQRQPLEVDLCLLLGVWRRS